ncbi:MAG: group II intron reverse transcriptase/maturase [Cytophagaceae bacterium]|nr:MAG: group II intron reverse transcriptase/maturase [Cytophagaceae bacterium]
MYVYVKKMEVLRTAYLMARAKRGAQGVDGVTSHQIEDSGRDAFLAEIKQSLDDASYSPGRYRKVDMPKGDGTRRTISIPTIRDRVVQGALKLILEPIFEADFADTSFGARPGRNAHQAIERVRKGLNFGKHYVVDVDLKRFFDDILHEKILSRVARRVQDPEMLAVIKAFLKSAGKRGMPQGSPLSPLLANLMLTDLDNALHDAPGFLFYMYLDYIIVLAPLCAKGRLRVDKALWRIQVESEAIGVSLNAEKTRTVCMTKAGASFDFLGFTFRWKEIPKRKKWYAHAEPKKSRVVALQRHLGMQMRRVRYLSVPNAVKLLNPMIRGWVNYFRGGNFSRVFTKVRHLVERLVRRFAARQRGRSGRGWNRWDDETVYAVWGLYRDYQIVYNYGLSKVWPPARRIITSSS